MNPSSSRSIPSTPASRYEEFENHVNLGQHYSQKSLFSKACCHYQQALQLQPHAPEIHYNLAVVFHHWGEWDLAETHYQTALQQQPHYPHAYFNLGVLKADQQRPSEAIAYYQQAIAQQPNYLNAYLNLGALWVQQEAYGQATILYREAIARFPQQASLHNNLGQLYQKQGEFAIALTQYETALGLAPGLAKVYENLGCLWLQHQDYAKAIHYLKQAIAFSPNPNHALSDCAAVALEQGDLETALAAIKQSIDLHPEPLARYCQITLEQKKSDNLLTQTQRACSLFIQSLQQGDSLPSASHRLFQVYCGLGAIAFESKAYARAAQCYQMAVQIEPQAQALYRKISDCLAQQGRWVAAQTVVQLANTLTTSGIQKHQASLQPETPRIDSPHPKPSVYPALTTAEWVAQSLPHKPERFSQAPVYESLNFQVEQWLSRSQNSLIRVLNASPLPVWETPSADSSTGQTEPGNACGGVTCHRCMEQLVQSFRPQQLAAGVFQCNLQAAPILPNPALFWATIPLGRAWVAPYESDWVACHEVAVMTPDQSLLSDLSRSYPWKLPPCPQRPQSQSGRISERTTLPPIQYLKGSVVLLSTLSSHIYYHWMIDLLPRLHLLKLAGVDFNQIDRFVVNSLRHSFQRETLQKLGIPLEKVIESDRTPHIQAEQLIVPSFPGHLDWIPPHTIEFLRRIFGAEHSRAQPKSHLKIYISRAKARYRRVLNEAEIIAVLKPLGFKVVTLESLTVQEQAELFAQAEVIISPHGSGLTNLVFCQSGAQIIELFSPHYLRTDYWMVSQTLKLQHFYIVGKSLACTALRRLMYPSSLMEDLWIDLGALRSALRLIQT